MKEASPAANPYESPAVLSDDAPALASADALPPLMSDKSFWGMTATQFLGAFNDNLFKQLMLLLAVPIVVAGAQASDSTDQQGLATIVFSLPFLLFSGYAGYLSDRYRKRSVIVWSKAAEIVMMLLGVVGFLFYGWTGYTGLLVVLFCMGAQSAFFGPGKYGILPEMLRGNDLPRANGIILMTTFIAIITGTITAGIFRDLLVDTQADGIANASRLWIGSLACVVIAIVGTATAFTIRSAPPAMPNLAFSWEAIGIPADTRAVLWNDKPLLFALLASSMFWLVSGLSVPVVNYVGLNEMDLSADKANTLTSLLNGCIGIGIAIGAVIAGKLCRGKADFRVTRMGAWGIVILLGLMGIYTADGKQLLGFGGSVPVMLLLGISAGLFAIPIQVFVQARPPEEQRGRIIAVMNQFNFTAILLSGALYTVFHYLVNGLGMPHTFIFALCGLIILPVALFYRPANVEL